MDTQVVEVHRLTKQFGSYKAVNNISFSLKEGEILGFLGKNGAGKTTTIQMLLGIMTPTSGEISYFGKEFAANRQEILEQVNFSSTYTKLPDILTVLENLTYVSYLYNIPHRAGRVKKIIDNFGLNPLLHKKINDLSAGQMTRVGLAKAFLNYPRVLLLDEPTASLDPDIAEEIRQFLLEQQNKFHVSIIITSHNMAEVEEICDRVVFIDQGRLIANDTPENLARSMDVSHVTLMVQDGLKRTVEYCHKRKMSYSVEGRYIVIDVEEKQIPHLLYDLMENGVRYDEISIKEPSLEDYFLQIVSKKNESA